MKPLLVPLLLLSCIFSFSACARLFNATHFDPFDVIVFTTINTNFRGIEYNYHNPGQFFVVGSSMFVVDTTPNMYLDYDKDISFSYNFIDAAIFNYSNGALCALGPVQYNVDHPIPTSGYEVPITLEVKTGNLIKAAEGALRPGYTPVAVAVDVSNIQKPLAYFVGWNPTSATEGSDLHLSVFRVHVDPDQVGSSAGPFGYNDTLDIVALSANQYTTYSYGYKPWVFHSANHSSLVVVDPNTRTVYKITTPSDPTQHMVASATLNLRLQPTSVAYHHSDNKLFIAHRGDDFSMQGVLMEINVDSLTFERNVTMGINESDPRAMVEYQNTLYIGLRGGPYILRVDVPTWKITGYIRLPFWLYNIESAYAHDGYVYFVTHEAHGKLFRVNMQDFCENPCDEFAYCKAGKCQCQGGYELKDGACHSMAKIVTNKEIVVDKGAAIAMGILFALAVIAGAAGWLMWWRGKRSVYQPV